MSYCIDAVLTVSMEVSGAIATHVAHERLILNITILSNFIEIVSAI
jgi:hypothetical protein